VCEKCPTPLIIREMQIIATMSYHFTPIRMGMIAITKQTRDKKDCRGREPWYNVGGNRD
jgi:hypothetical protein